ncbi:MAG: hypothetical protein K9J17_01015 [Flavobacteriales bacterium]|nr:hypothetical protein [Flavobacteriales bacterium]
MSLIKPFERLLGVTSFQAVSSASVGSLLTMTLRASSLRGTTEATDQREFIEGRDNLYSTRPIS